MQDLIRTTGLTKRYGAICALDQIDITIPTGGVTALVGPNGSGKSTLIKLCIGFERPSAGRLEVLGIDPVRHRRQAVAALGYVPQTPSLYRDISIDDHLGLAAGLRPNFDKAYARDRIAALDIPLTATPTELSGGQAAQVSLAVALGTRAPLLLLDEPLANLDPLARREFLEIVRDAVTLESVSVILSSHVLSEIEDVADRLLVLSEGKVLLHQTVRASLDGHRVLDDPREARGDELVAVFPTRRRGRQALLATSDAVGRPATLEEVVLGYLASVRVKVDGDEGRTRDAA